MTVRVRKPSKICLFNVLFSQVAVSMHDQEFRAAVTFTCYELVCLHQLLAGSAILGHWQPLCDNFASIGHDYTRSVFCQSDELPMVRLVSHDAHRESSGR